MYRVQIYAACYIFYVSHQTEKWIDLPMVENHEVERRSIVVDGNAIRFMRKKDELVLGAFVLYSTLY